MTNKNIQSDRAKKRRKARIQPPLIIGWREYVSLPQLGLDDFTAKIDTGALTTALHATDIRRFTGEDGRDWVEFHPPDLGHSAPEICRARVSDHRQVKNSGGIAEDRYFIRTDLKVEHRVFLVEISLTDRGEMKYPMLIGRTALRGHGLVVDCGHSWLTRPRKPKKNHKSQGVTK
ncbi:ATP-dependent zinc protease family protein [Aliiruegeria sabulilitoris]|uniref:ATP-dependent zinc protease family protein n=1 Tax=Aliiruegeria sabulilitoris TaxID=1510458 RepID=UPI0008337643|nr:RimK/LysX family protein [Aliiruegeria sabulilitoris]NDR59734.1 ATP-dependent zinc protease [Pseudoruegeria sp. M32A2M]